MNGASSSNVERGAEILLELGKASQDGMTLTELAKALGDAKPATHRALMGLSKRGFVQQISVRGKYRIGPAVYALAMKSFSTRAVVEKVRPALIESSYLTGGSTYLLARAGLDAVCLDIEEGQFITPSTVGSVGGRQPIGMGAASICMLGVLDQRSREIILQYNEKRISQTIPRDRVASSVEFFEKNGYAIYTPNLKQSTINIGVAIPQEKIRMVAAISVILPDREGVDVPKVANLLKQAISSRIL